VAPRGQWDDLRRQLERLPPGHPSRPGDEDLADGDGVGDNLADEHRADRGTADEPDSPARRGVALGITKRVTAAYQAGTAN
jgi:hypothetical protein